MANECMFKLTVKSNNLDSLNRFLDVLQSRYKNNENAVLYRTHIDEIKNFQCSDDTYTVDIHGECAWTLYNLIITEDELKEYFKESPSNTTFEQYFDGKKYTNMQYWCKELGVEVEGHSFTLNYYYLGSLKINNNGEVLDFSEKYPDEMDDESLSNHYFGETAQWLLIEDINMSNEVHQNLDQYISNEEEICYDENDEIPF